MKSIALVAQKGGTGKTTIALHLAVTVPNAVLGDLDPQGSAAAWQRLRGREPDVYMLNAGDGARFAATAVGEGRFPILDTAPHLRGAATGDYAAVDLAIVPVRPSILDLFALDDTRRALSAARTPAVVVLSAVGRSREADEAADVLARDGWVVAPVRISERIAYRRALASGKAGSHSNNSPAKGAIVGR